MSIRTQFNVVIRLEVKNNVDIFFQFLKNWALNKKYIAEKDDFEILRCPFVTFNDRSGHTSFNERFESLYC